MGSLGNPQSWAPYENVKDCSQGFCSLYCPEWCYIIFPPPPPIAFSDNDSKANFSPLVIAIIGILASAFLLVSYYTVISKYCNMDSSRRNANQDPGEEFHENQNQSNNELWQVSTAGLDEALIKLIAVCKYKTGDGLVEGTDCSVCLSEFQENESLRLLPKCSHAFHLSCIDTWLKSHSNCPLCRANVMITSSPLPPQLPSPMHDTSSGNGSSDEGEQDNHTVVAVQDLERNEEFSQADNVAPKMYSRATSQMGRSEDRDIVIEIRDEGLRPVRRSVSMDSSSCNGHVSIADILSTSEDDESDTEIHGFQVGVGSSSSKHTVGEDSKSSNRSRSRVLHCVTSPTPMKRSFSSGKFLFTRQGRARM